ncbi:hydroxymethylglutaryl-CoA synthase [Helcococcus massiliensis]|uniref:hydroxymethylglutaryl-CoA synthase n=1 Tax=Helcococcus massiliensis TaxID=2040290 RepID=UPI000CDE7DFF|nr:hydroxymethylglutaryl-CoA synthase [Helcococcus massiliensis]
MSKTNKVGIEKIGLYLPKYYVDLVDLAEKRGVDPNKWTIGIGQEKMSVIEESEDIVTMAANAANKILTEEDKKNISQVVFATESSIDFSKSAASQVHRLLSINKFAKSYEVKQACYSATAALLNAYNHVKLNPEEKVLILSSDIASYGANSGGEVTQGAGAIAILVSNKAEVLELSGKSLALTHDCYDFWRPSYREYPLVDGKLSTDTYINMFKENLEGFMEKYEDSEDSLQAFLFHLPFTKMGKKALVASREDLGEKYGKQIDQWLGKYEDSTRLTRQVGNLYTGSLYLAFISQLIYGALEAGQEIGLFSYGSGAVSEIFTGYLAENYRDHIDVEDIENSLNTREEMSLDYYDEQYFKSKYIESQDKEIRVREDVEGFYLEKIKDGKRYYSHR